MTAVPVVTAPTLLLTEPVPTNTPVRVVDVPAGRVVFAAAKLVIDGAGTTVTVAAAVTDAPVELVTVSV